jgi:acyl carrier protein
VDALPLTPSGKLDRRALPAPDFAPAEEEYVAPRSPMETELAELWAELLGVERVGRDQGFFQLGGHSLLMLRMQARIREHMGRQVPVVDLFRYPTVASLAAYLEGGDEAPAPRRGSERAARRRALAAGRGSGRTSDSPDGEDDQ